MLKSHQHIDLINPPSLPPSPHTHFLLEVENFLCNGPDGKYSRLCRIQTVPVAYSALFLFCFVLIIFF